MSYGAPGSGRLGPAYPIPSSLSTGYSTSASGYNSSAYFTKTGSTPPSTTPLSTSTTTGLSSQFSYSTGSPYTGYTGIGPVIPGAQGRGRGGGRGRGMGRGRGSGGGRGGGRGGGIGPQQPKAKIIKPQPPPPLSTEEKSKIENHNMKQLVAPKPPHRILNEMVGGGVTFEYTENPPLPPGANMDSMPTLHTLITSIDGDTSTGTGPSHEIAKNICAEHAIMEAVTKRYDKMKELVQQGAKTKEDLMLQDETPFELASIAIFKMLNEWEASGYELPQAIEDVLYSPQMFVPVKQRLDWIRGSNMGFSTPINGGVNLSGRKRPMTMPTGSSIDAKQPVSFLNEIRGTVEYMLLGTWGTGPATVFTMGVNIDGIPYSGNGPSKKDAKKNCAKDILNRLYRITI